VLHLLSRYLLTAYLLTGLVALVLAAWQLAICCSDTLAHLTRRRPR
jgi:hypothetical protein